MGTPLGIGVLVVLLGGILQGSFLLPLKFTRRWEWENSWIGFSTVAYLLAPWLLAFVLVPHFPRMLHDVPPKVIITTLVYGLGWGIGALSMGTAYKYVGMAITYAIVLGVASSIGTLIPLLVLGSKQVRSNSGLHVIAAVVIGVIGTAVVSWAAWQRDATKSSSVSKTGETEALEKRRVIIGLGLCLSAGVLASFGNLGFAFGTELSRKAAELGAGPTGSASAVWVVLCFPVFLCNFIYSLYLLRKNRSAHCFRTSGTSFYWGLIILMGVLWMGGMAAYGAGALAMGRMGTSVGWVLFMTSMIISGNLLGLLTGEWKGSSKKSLMTMMAGVSILILAVILAGTSGAT
ncbi:MAG: L-rhamnose/proton symporter RhaT [Acidobacteriaceae bacterium]